MPPTPVGIPPYQKWMKETSVWNKPRSKEMKELDAAIQDYDRSTLAARDAKLYNIRQYLNAWKAKEGPHWMQSVRNQTGIITALDKFLNGTTQGLTREEMEAWKLVCAAARENCKKMMMGRQLTVKNTSIGGTLADIASAAKTAYSTAKTVHSVATGVTPLAYQGSKVALQATGAAAHLAIEHAAHDLLKACFDVADIHIVMHALGPLFAEVVHSITPFIGMVANGAKAAVGWGLVIKQGWERYQLGQITESFAPGDPEAAFKAILVIVNRNLQAQVGDATIATTGFGLQVGLFFADGGAVSGPVVGVAACVAKLLSQIIQFARDYKETKKVNAQLLSGPWDLTLFKTCPLLGCYLIACSDTSAVINLAIDEFGSDQWVDKIEMLKAKADPAIEKAGDLIRDSRYEIRELRHSKGVVKPHPKVFGYNPIDRVKGLANSFGSTSQNIENVINRPPKH